MKKILHIINSLDTGGAEASLLRIINNDKKNSIHKIILLRKGFSILKKNKKNYENIHYVYHFNYFTIIFYFIHLVFVIRKYNPDTLCCWMYHSCIIGGLAAKLNNFKKIFWLVRHNDPKGKYLNARTKFSMFVFKILSFLVPDTIIYNSSKSLVSHKKYGVNQKVKNIFIPNGYEYYPSLAKKNLDKSKVVFANICRWDKQKNHMLLLESLSIFQENNPNIEWLIVMGGSKVDNNNKVLIEKIKNLKLNKRVKLVGEIVKINEIFSSVDFYIQSSTDESFPNIVAEAMLYNTPVIGTNVGDTSSIISKFGWLTTLERNNIAENIQKAVNYRNNDLKWRAIKNQASDHIINNFSINKTIEKFYSLWN